MKPKISYSSDTRTVIVSGGTKESPAHIGHVNKYLEKNPHYILDQFKTSRPEVYRHIVGLLVTLYKDSTPEINGMTILKS